MYKVHRSSVIVNLLSIPNEQASEGEACKDISATHLGPLPVSYPQDISSWMVWCTQLACNLRCIFTGTASPLPCPQNGDFALPCSTFFPPSLRLGSVYWNDVAECGGPASMSAGLEQQGKRGIHGCHLLSIHYRLVHKHQLTVNIVCVCFA